MWERKGRFEFECHLGLFSGQSVKHPLVGAAFIFLAGFSLVLARARGAGPRQHLRHLAVIGAAALAISAATYAFAPDAFIFFGILHAIAVSALIALPLLAAPLWLVATLALAAIAAPALLASHSFDGPWLWWLGLNAGEPRTLDYRPLLPWLGVLLAGTLAARLWARADPKFAALRLKRGTAATRLLAFGGRHSLAVYLLHQPVFIGIVYVIALFVPPVAVDRGAQFINACQANCTKAGGAPQVCLRGCACIVDGLKERDLWIPVLMDRLDAKGRVELDAIVNQCRAP